MLLMQKAASRQAIANKGFMVPALSNSKKSYFRKIGISVYEELMNIEDATGLSQLIKSIYEANILPFCLHHFFMQNTRILHLK